MDLFYSPFKKIIKEELPLSENFPYTFNPNRSKNYFDNIYLNKNNEISFENIIKNIETQLKKYNNNLLTVVIIDNLSTLPITKNNLLDEINMLLKFLSDRVIIIFL